MFTLILNIGSVTIQTGYDTKVGAEGAANEVLVLSASGVIAPAPTSMKITDPEGDVIYSHQF